MAQSLLTDGGLETDLIFNRGIDLPEFAAFPLLDSGEGRDALRSYYSAYVELAVRAEASVLLETPTWRANPDHATALGYDAAALDRVNRDAVEMLTRLAKEYDDELVGWQVGGILGPRGDGYRVCDACSSALCSWGPRGSPYPRRPSRRTTRRPLRSRATSAGR